MLVTLEQAKAHLKRDFPDAASQNDLALKIDHASAIVIDHIKRPDHTWTVNTQDDVEFSKVQAAVLKVLGNLYYFRGDDDRPTGPLTDDVVRLLSSLRPPTLA